MATHDYLIWIDLEMTGLMPETDQIIEIATVVTDKDLNVVAEGPDLAIRQPEETLALFCTRHWSEAFVPVGTFEHTFM